MSMQLTFDFTPRHQREHGPIIQNEAWLDVSDIARGVGFTSAVQISVTLNDALQSLQNEIDGGYDQRLYDVLWTAHFKLSLDQSQSVLIQQQKGTILWPITLNTLQIETTTYALAEQMPEDYCDLKEIPKGFNSRTIFNRDFIRSEAVLPGRISDGVHA